MPDVIVVGAGVSGLMCARRLKASGLDVVVLEPGEKPGGVVSSEHVDGYLLESGPNTILPTPASMAMIDEAGILDQMVEAPTKAPRFVYAGGRLRRVPWVLSVFGTLRALAEPFVSRRDRDGEESLESFFDRRFGPETHRRLAAPFVTGIYAGDTSELSVEAVFPRLVELEKDYGSVVLGLLRNRKKRTRHRLASFRDGMGRLGSGLAEGIDIRLRTGADEIVAGPEGVPWQVRAAARTFDARAVVVAAPAWAASRLMRDFEELREALDAVCYAPVVVANVSVADHELSAPLEGFGFLAPRQEGLSVLGTLFNSFLFPGRAPKGQNLLTSFVGGRLSPEALDWPDAEMWTRVCGDVERVLQLRTGAVCPIRLKRYRRAIPQYRLGHLRWRSELESRVRSRPGLFLTGNYLDGVSVPASMEHGARTADRVIQHIRRTS